VPRIYDYLAELNPYAAKQVVGELMKAGESLTNFPHRGRLIHNTALRELISTYPYIIRYRIARDGIRILRVRHTSRRPNRPWCHQPRGMTVPGKEGRRHLR
jgi:plasmid stabilization system protein ParE